MKKLSLFIVLSSAIYSQIIDPDIQRRISFPDIPGYKTLICDLHQHTVFSDGTVWPTIRVSEALKDNLDAIAVTEHLEHQPHKQDIPHPDRNRAYHIEKESNHEDLIIINGSEITRNMPLGHSNAIFVKDANRLLLDNPLEAFQEAKKQGAFIFWNHPHWEGQKKDGIAALNDIQKQLIKEKLLFGIEVVNEFTYSAEALQIALDNDLTILGTSDVHGLVDWDYKVPMGGHRPVTLVFAGEKTEDAIKEALFKKRTVVFFKNLLIGRIEYLVPLLSASLTIKSAKYHKDTTILDLTVNNESSCEFILQNNSDYTFHDYGDILKIKPGAGLKIKIKTVSKMEKIVMPFKVLNAVYAPAQHPDIRLESAIQ